jgi:hypothetical protein
MSFIRSLQNDSEKIKSSKIFSIIIEIIALLSFAIFILFGQVGHKIGFPLDDAWIHQTYARNLVESGKWIYTNGTVSGGSTSPLWTILLSIGYVIKKGIPWTFILSAAIYLLVIFFSARLIKESDPRIHNWKLLLASSIVMLDWHLLWAAASGMETVFFILGIIILFYSLILNSPNWLFIGIINGVLIWIRPDGLTLLGPSLLILIIGSIQRKCSWKEWLRFFGPFITILILFMGFNYAISGEIFSNTFYAKQAEYQTLLSQPLTTRFIDEFTQIITGAGILVLPGFIYAFFHYIKNRDFKAFAIVLWIFGYIIIYSLRLPVTYQHGRYMMPVMVPFLLIGITGIINLVGNIRAEKVQKLLTTAWFGAIIFTSAVFYVLGLQTYRSDVEVINNLLVEPANWIEQNIPEADKIATHDIGAIGYFTNHPIVDLAGLINPEIIPMINNEPELLHYMKSKNVAYYIGFYDWYKTSDQWGSVVKEFSEIYKGKDEKIVIIQLKDY